MALYIRSMLKCSAEMESRHLSVLLLLAGVLCFRAVNGCPQIISRSAWGAKNPTSTTKMNTPVPYVIIHHTVTAPCFNQAKCSAIVRNVQNDHMAKPKGYDDIGYSFLVGGDGKVYEGRGWNRVGAHAPGYNEKSIGISFIGNFEVETPSKPQLDAAKSLIACGVQLRYISSTHKLLGHRQTKATECPGIKLYNIIKTWPRWSITP